MGGDFNCTTNVEQSAWGRVDPFDNLAPQVKPPKRTSQDTRRTNNHGKRFLEALSDKGIILNGISDLMFSDAFTRLPQRLHDCPGVLDYVSTSPMGLQVLQPRSFQIVETHPDFSDHHLVKLTIDLPDNGQIATHDARKFLTSQLSKLKLLEDDETWAMLDGDMHANIQFEDTLTRLRKFASQPSMTATKLKL